MTDQTSSTSSLSLADVLRAMKTREAPWERWARDRGLACRLQPSDYPPEGEVYSVALEPQERMVVAHPKTVDLARHLLRPMSDRDLATMLAWYADQKVQR